MVSSLSVFFVILTRKHHLLLHIEYTAIAKQYWAKINARDLVSIIHTGV